MAGVSLVGTTATVLLIDRLAVSLPPLARPPLSLMLVRVTVRLPAVGVSLLLR